MPRRHGSGADLRFYSNIRAYLDLGFEVEGIQIASNRQSSEASSDLTPVRWTRVIEPAEPPGFIGKFMFRAGVPTHDSTSYFIETYPLVVREVEKRCKIDPEAIFHMEGEAMASALPRMKDIPRRIWSLHDLPSTVSNATTRIACDAECREPTPAEKREARFAEKYERFIARNASLILCIADYDVQRLHSWGCNNVQYLPLSIPDAEVARRKEVWLPDGELRLLHLGNVSHLPSYRSLEFILERIWPSLSKAAIARIKLNVVGTFDLEKPRAKRIRELARPYSNVIFHGFVQDILPVYRENDLQIVASTDASGLRTRTIESFAFGLPVLSTSIAARGIPRLNSGHELLLADEPTEIAGLLSHLMESPDLLRKLADNARTYYEQNNSRTVVAASLAKNLERYFGCRF
jgi:glycosyltransferase involved in cell wall biosynthesis